MSDLDDLIWEETAERMTAAQFAAAHPYWFVAYDEPDDEGDLGFRTELAGKPPDTKRLTFAPLTKSARNPYADRISVGRARNSDVVVRHASVSKLHAHFRDADGALTITDVGSHNGTRVDGRLLVAHRPQSVIAGSLVIFGRVEARILTASGAHELLRRR